MRDVRERERWIRAFHDARPGITSRALARAGSYERLAAKVPRDARVLDVACGDGTLLALLGPNAIGIDVSRGELQQARARDTSTCTTVVQARAQALPFADRSFDAATCHLAFMLFDDIELVVAELARVLGPGAPFIALVGGGPTADGHDAFHRFLDLLTMTKAAGPVADPLITRSDRRASTEAGWHELFAGWNGITFERWPLDLGGSFDDVWTFLSSAYQFRADYTEHVRKQLRAAFPGEHVPCTVVTYLATVTR
jgi:SAM-dependent methyltransferase